MLYYYVGTNIFYFESVKQMFFTFQKKCSVRYIKKGQVLKLSGTKEAIFLLPTRPIVMQHDIKSENYSRPRTKWEEKRYNLSYVQA